jgi:hypothetical protein
MSKSLLWLHDHPRATWVILLVYAALVTFPHEQVQEIVGSIAKSMGRANLYRLAFWIGIVCAAILTAAFSAALRRHQYPKLIASYWAATLVLIFATWKILTVNNTELVHYPQYFVPGAILMALTLSPLETLAWITLVGSFDEGYQYAVLHAGWGIPFDFNDIFMDFLGGALGVIFALAFLPCASPKPASLFRKPGVALLSLTVATCAILLATGKMLLYKDPANHSYWMALSRLQTQSFWFFDETWGPKKFHTLTPLEGPALLIAALAFYAVLDRKLAISPPTGQP